MSQLILGTNLKGNWELPADRDALDKADGAFSKPALKCHFGKFWKFPYAMSFQSLELLGRRKLACCIGFHRHRQTN